MLGGGWGSKDDAFGRLNKAKEGYGDKRVQEKKRKRVGFISEFVVEGVSFALVVETLEKVVDDCFGGDTIAVLAHWCFGAMDAEEMLVKGEATSAELYEDGRLVVVKAINKPEIGIQWKKVIYVGSKPKIWRFLSSISPVVA